LLKLSQSNPVPETAQPSFVEAVVTAATGNPYGVSHAASPYYDQMVKSFSPNEVKLMLDLPRHGTIVENRIRTSKGCERRYRNLVALIDSKTVPTSSKALYAKWLPKA
jgi:membrane carboxypeptidase/penicillin-binding protein